MTIKCFKVFQKTPLRWDTEKLDYELRVGDGYFLTDFRFSIERCFSGGYDCLNSALTNFQKWFGMTRVEAGDHFEIVEYEIKEIRRLTVAEARKLRNEC